MVGKTDKLFHVFNNGDYADCFLFTDIFSPPHGSNPVPHFDSARMTYRKRAPHFQYTDSIHLKYPKKIIPLPFGNYFFATMECLLHYVWQHRLFPLGTLHTTDGKKLEIIDVGQHNHDAGPDFFNAKIKMDGQLWVGNVEIHRQSSDWYRHRHDSDAKYNNVVLHVVEEADMDVKTEAGLTLPQMMLTVPPEITNNYDELMTEASYPPCHRILPTLPAFHTHAWLNALTTERLEAKTQRIHRWIEHTAGDWERAFFITLARAFGFGKNADALELWASTIEPQHIGKHRDNLLQVEAFFMGQAGWITPEMAHSTEEYLRALEQEYRFLRHKFNLTPIAPTHWKWLRLRPQNFPERRVAQLAELYASRRLDFSKIRAATSLAEMHTLLNAHTSPYWRDHYSFGRKDEKPQKRKPKNSDETAISASSSLSSASLDLLIINAVAPMLFAYGRSHQNEEYTERAFNLLEAIRPEQNHITRHWQQASITAEHAADSQALIHLKQQYCDRKDCLRCRFGAHYLRKP